MTATRREHGHGDQPGYAPKSFAAAAFEGPPSRNWRPASEGWWSQTGSNRRPHACKARALPAELWPRNQKTNAALDKMVGLGRLELPTSRLSSARSNQLSYKPSAREAASKPPAGRRQADRLARTPGACSSAKKEKRRRRNPANEARMT